jgi:hypothetical protein
MKKLSPLLTALSFATLSACGGGATGPNPATPGGKVVAWAGTAQRTTQVSFGPLDSTTTWEITNLTWVEDDGEVVGLNGATLYKIGSGRVKQTIRQVTGPCLVTGETEFTLLPGDGSLAVGGGVYSGRITRRVEDPITVTGDCGFGAGSADIGGQLELVIDSANDPARSASRLRGTKTFTVAASVHTSTWDFTATAWER